MNHQIALNKAALITAVVASLFFMPSLLDPFNMPKLVMIVIGGAVCLGLLLGFTRDWWDVRLVPVLVVVGVFLAALVAASIASPQSWYRTAFGAWSRNNGALVYAALAILVVAIAIGSRTVSLAQRTLNALVWMGAIQGLYALIQTTGNDPVPWNNPYNPIIGTVGNPNFASALMSLCTIATLQGILDPRSSRARRLTYSLLAVLQLIMIYRSDSQQGLLAFAVGGVIVFAAWMSLQLRDWVRRLTWPFLGLSTVGGILTIAALFNFGPLAPIIYQISLRRRLDYWKTALEMLQAHPVFGVGIDSYGDWFRFYRLPEQVEWNGTPDVISNNAHNVVLQLGATGGLTLMLAYLALMIFVGWRGLVLLRTSDERLMAAGLVGSWAGFQMQSLVSIDQLGLTVWGWILAGAVIGFSYRIPGKDPHAMRLRPSGRVPMSASQRARTQAPLSRYTVPALLAAGALGIASTAVGTARLNDDSEVRSVTAVAVDTQNSDLVSQTADRIYSVALGSPEPHWQTLSIIKLYEMGAVSQGIQLAQAATTRFPHEIDLWNLLASAYESNQLWPEAVSARQKTVELDPLNYNFRDQFDKARQQAQASSQG